ncbi:MAG: TIGR02594 family protein, partial [Hyphomicrobiales bacterium]
MTGAYRDMRYPSNATQEAADQEATSGAGGSRRHGRQSLAEARAQAQSHANSAFGGVTSDALVSEARKYIGTNPTGRGSLWCGAFMDLVLKRTGHAGGGNLASA